MRTFSGRGVVALIAYLAFHILRLVGWLVHRRKGSDVAELVDVGKRAGVIAQLGAWLSLPFDVDAAAMYSCRTELLK